MSIGADVGLGSRPSTADCRVADLRAVLATGTDPTDYPLAEDVVDGVLVYAADRLTAASRDAASTELVRALSDGPGVVLVRGAFQPAVVERASETFAAILAEQRTADGSRGDHFARPGAHDRVWNALEKLAVRAPATFVDYYANPVLALVAEAWLGPAYQVTAQLNVVNPGGAAQVGHRDYHLGFLTPEQIERYPAHVHRLSPVLTLQGAVAHSDMPVATGPTCYLPGSQRYPLGYLATGLPEFREYFDEHHVQPPLRLGDAAFFNPAVIHGAGTNRTADVRRAANLLQVSSAFGRPMEAVDRERVCNAIYPALRERFGFDAAGTLNAVAAAAAGYPFPTDLDRDPPVDGLAQPSQADVVRRALAEHRSPEAVRRELAALSARRGGGW